MHSSPLCLSSMDSTIVGSLALGSVVALLYIYKRYIIKGVMCPSNARIDGKTVIITGANTGIGKETARELASRGGRIILACRDLEKARQVAAEIALETRNHNIAVRRLDLSSIESIRNFAQEIKEGEENVHILINNAGLGAIPQSKTKDGFEMTFGVNHLGHFLLTQLLLDLVVKSAPSRIVNVAAHAHIIGELDFDDLMMDKKYNSVIAYCRSKMANILFTRELARKLDGTGVTTYSLHPGVIHTELGRHFRVMKAPVLKHIGNWLMQNFLKTAVEGCQTTVYCAVAEELADHSGLYYSNCAISNPIVYAFDNEKAEKLWNLSEKLLELNQMDVVD